MHRAKISRSRLFGFYELSEKEKEGKVTRLTRFLTEVMPYEIRRGESAEDAARRLLELKEGRK